ncbi:MAG: HD domain-containing protein [Bryobacteraceae bacterium]
MCGLARMLAGHYKNVDLDLLLAGILLHDIGKIHELTYDRGFGYSTEGQLLGHIHIGLRLIGDKLRSLPEFPSKLRTLLEHMILSHHGELEYGSPKQPMFAEALLLHYIDNIDSKVECVRAFSEKDRCLEGCWTSYNSSLDRAFLKKQKYLDDAPPPPVNTHQAVAAAAPSPLPVAKTLLAEKLMGALKGNG